jgi:hypothetical protein
MKTITKLSCIAIPLIGICACSDNDQYTNEAAFIIQPFCKEEVSQYFDMLNQVSAFRARIIEIPDSGADALPTITSMGLIETTIDDVDLGGYVLGARDNCVSSSTTFIDLESDPINIQFILKDIDFNNPGRPVYIELVDGILHVFQ